VASPSAVGSMISAPYRTSDIPSSMAGIFFVLLEQRVTCAHDSNLRFAAPHAFSLNHVR
jgi:hypothetical protein